MKSARSVHPRRRGPFRAEQLRPGDPYELSDGHAIVCEPSGRRHGRRNLDGAAVIAADPAVEAAGVDVGYVLDQGTLRAPDVSVGNLGDEPGFARGAPALAIEYPEEGSDEADLELKIAELLAAGTRVVWVVRLGGERRVEVHRAGEQVAVKRSGEELEAPGILHNPVPVDALYDSSLAHQVTLRNLLQRQGYESLEAVRAEGRDEGLVRGALEHGRRLLKRMLALRGIAISPHDETAIDCCNDLGILDRWLDRAIVASSADEVLRSG